MKKDEMDHAIKWCEGYIDEAFKQARFQGLEPTRDDVDEWFADSIGLRPPEYNEWDAGWARAWVHAMYNLKLDRWVVPTKETQ